MNEGNITVTLTESQHELLLDVICHAQEAMDFTIPFDGMCDLPLENVIVQRYTSLGNLREMLYELWTDRFE
jgi:hypothetical protein